jgi:putative peptidoglycan lipid II flippase
MSRKLLKSTAVTGSMTLLSRISGLVRDIVFAGLIGAGAGVAADAFYVAFRIPNFLRRIFGEGAFSQAFVPVVSEYKATRTHEETQDLVSHTAGMLGAILFLITLAGVAAAPILVYALAPGFADESAKFDLTVSMLRITFPYILFVSLVAMAAGLLNTYGKFAAPAFTPVLLNLCLIGAALWLAPLMEQPVVALAWGVFLAGLVQLAFQIPFLKRIGFLARPRFKWRHPGVTKISKLMLPAIFGSSVVQVNLLVNTLLASFLVTGSVSWLYYSDRLMEFPLGVFGIALATVILPSLSRRHAQQSPEDFSHLLDWALRLACVIAIPASVALVVLAGPLLATFFHFGAFTEHDVRMSAQALQAFSLGLSGFILVKVLAPGFYARQDTKTPVKIGVIAMLANIALGVALVFPLKHVGLALAISLSAFVNAALLYAQLNRTQIYRPLPGWGVFLGRVGLAAFAMGTLLFWGVGDLTSWIHAKALDRVGRLLFWVVAGLVTYVAAVLLLGLRPSQFILKRSDHASHDD